MGTATLPDQKATQNYDVKNMTGEAQEVHLGASITRRALCLVICGQKLDFFRQFGLGTRSTNDSISSRRRRSGRIERQAAPLRSTITAYGVAVIIVFAILNGIFWWVASRHLHELNVFSDGFVLGMFGMYFAAWLYGYRRVIPTRIL